MTHDPTVGKDIVFRVAEPIARKGYSTSRLADDADPWKLIVSGSMIHGKDWKGGPSAPFSLFLRKASLSIGAPISFGMYIMDTLRWILTPFSPILGIGLIYGCVAVRKLMWPSSCEGLILGAPTVGLAYTGARYSTKHGKPSSVRSLWFEEGCIYHFARQISIGT